MSAINIFCVSLVLSKDLRLIYFLLPLSNLRNFIKIFFFLYYTFFLRSILISILTLPFQALQARRLLLIFFHNTSIFLILCQTFYRLNLLNLRQGAHLRQSSDSELRGILRSQPIFFNFVLDFFKVVIQNLVVVRKLGDLLLILITLTQGSNQLIISLVEVGLEIAHFFVQFVLSLVQLLPQGRVFRFKLDDGSRVLYLKILKIIEERSVLLDRPCALVLHSLQKVLFLGFDLILELLVLLSDAP